MSRYRLVYLDLKEKSFNKESTLRKFMWNKAYKNVRVIKDNELMPFNELDWLNREQSSSDTKEC